MTVQSAQAVTVLFTTRVFSTGIGTNADSLPTGTLYVNGTANGATVTVTNISTGLYKAAVTLPTLAINDIVSISIAATVSTVPDTATIWRDTKDFIADASGFATANLNGDLTATMKTSVTTAATAATPTAAAVTGNVGGNVTGSVGSVVGLTASNLDTTVSSRLASVSYAAPDNADIVLIKAKTDNLPASPAAVSDIPTANQNADALLDRAAGVETGRTPRQALRLMLAALAGKLSGAATTTVSIRDTNDSKNRIVATVDADGNRSAVTLDAS